MSKKQPTIYEEIEARRVLIGKSKYRIFKDTGHSQQAIGDILNPDKDRSPRFDTLQDIVKSLGGTLTIVWDDTLPKQTKRK